MMACWQPIPRAPSIFGQGDERQTCMRGERVSAFLLSAFNCIPPTHPPGIAVHSVYVYSIRLLVLS